jgi:hypothetical protein
MKESMKADMMKEREKAYGAFIALQLRIPVPHRMHSSLLHGCQAGFDGLMDFYTHTHLRAEVRWQEHEV